MNEDKMELEEAIVYLKKIAKEYKTYGDLDNPEFEDIMKIPEAIETVLKALKNSIPKKKIEDVLKKIQEEYELLLEHQSGKESNRTKYLQGKIHLAQELLEEK